MQASLPFSFNSSSIAPAFQKLANIRNSFAQLRLLDSATPLAPGAATEFETSFAGLVSACDSAMGALGAVTGGSIRLKPPELDSPESDPASPDAPEVTPK